MSGDERIYLGQNRLLVRTRWGGWVETPTFNVDVAVGAIRDGTIEPWTTRLVQELLRPGQVYFNAGANFGYYVALGGQLVGETGKVFAVEPNPHILPYLLRTIYWSGVINRVRVFDVALGRESGGEAQFLFDPQFLGAGAVETIVQAQGADLPEAPDFAAALWSAETIRSRFDANHEFQPARQMRARFSAPLRAIDDICGGAALDLLHLDIEGSEALALRGAFATLDRSPQARLITEWSARHHREGTDESRAAFDEVWRFLEQREFRVRRLQPDFAADGGLMVSAPLGYADMTQTAEHGDYVWVRPQHDPW